MPLNPHPCPPTLVAWGALVACVVALTGCFLSVTPAPIPTSDRPVSTRYEPCKSPASAAKAKRLSCS